MWWNDKWNGDLDEVKLTKKCSQIEKLGIKNFPSPERESNPWPSRYRLDTLTTEWGETGGSETPASRTFYSRFPPPSVGVPASLFYFYCKILLNISKFFTFSLGSRHLGIPLPTLPSPASRTLSPPILPGSRPPVPLHHWAMGDSWWAKSYSGFLSFNHIYHLDIFEPCSMAGHVSPIRTQNMTSLTTSRP